VTKNDIFERVLVWACTCATGVPLRSGSRAGLFLLCFLSEWIAQSARPAASACNRLDVCFCCCQTLHSIHLHTLYNSARGGVDELRTQVALSSL
jgi:hypothetical protein